MTYVESLGVALAAARDELQRVKNFQSPAGFTFQPWVIEEAERRAKVLEDAYELARTSTPPVPVPVKREPMEDPEARRARIWESRERRLAAAQARIAAYEAAHPVNEHGVRTGPSIASNNWRHRDAAQARELDAWRQYEHDLKTARHLAALLNKEDQQ